MNWVTVTGRDGRARRVRFDEGGEVTQVNTYTQRHGRPTWRAIYYRGAAGALGVIRETAEKAIRAANEIRNGHP